MLPPFSGLEMKANKILRNDSNLPQHYTASDIWRLWRKLEELKKWN